MRAGRAAHLSEKGVSRGWQVIGPMHCGRPLTPEAALNHQGSLLTTGEFLWHCSGCDVTGRIERFAGRRDNCLVASQLPR